jgi:hypothetical protein
MIDDKKLLLEDLTMPGGQYNQWSKDPSGTSQQPKKVSLIDLIDYQNKNEDDLTKAPNVLPFPLTKNVVEQIGDIYVQSAKIQSELGQAYQSPLISDNETATNTIKSLYKKLERVKLTVKSITQELKKLDIE